jgi:metallo-beta-lactamase family protein
VKLSFHGADRDVTGSCHLIEVAGKRLLIDCGLFQGNRELDEENEVPFRFDPAAIDYVLQTHAHLDHCGRLPLLVKRGFRGEIISTAPTHELVRIVLEDAARIEEEDAARRARWRARGGRSSGQRGARAGQQDLPLYTSDDAQAAIDCFGRHADYAVPLELGAGLRVSYHDAGHILGSASVLVEAEEGGRSRRVLFSGDIGNRGRPILRDPQPPRADIVLMETTYGNRLHRSVKDSVAELIAAIQATLQRGGNVVIPSFALERTQELLYFLREATASGQLPRNLPVFLDSPMAASAVEVYRRFPQFFDAAAAALVKDGSNPFDIPGLRMTRGREESMAINRIAGGAVIIAGSGMCTGGRVRHHLMHNLSNPASAIVFVGFAARGTPARAIIDGARSISLLGEDLPVRAHIHTINGFSAHADQKELLHWHSLAGGAERTVLVHGEVTAMEQFATLLGKTPVTMPAPGDELTL